MFDKLIASAFLLLLIPFLLILMFFISISVRENPIFIQYRTGKNKQYFKLYKLKTMKNEKINAFGIFLRKYGIDEIPQLVNVLKGEMSLVGPRPLLPEYDSYYSDIQELRFLVKPGITGLAQVRGRNLLAWHQRFRYDVFYAKKNSFGLDCQIIFQTFVVLFQSKENPISEKFAESFF